MSFHLAGTPAHPIENMSSETNTSETSTEVADVMGMAPKTFCMIVHLSQLFNFWVPPCGFVLPVVLWALAKEKNALVDQHGKIVLNWIISSVIYCLVVWGLCLIFIGIPLALLLFVLMIIFPVIGALKANEGVAWKYPLSIPFFK